MGYLIAILILAFAAILQVGLLPEILHIISPIDFGLLPLLNIPLLVELYYGQLGLVLLLVVAWSIHAPIEEAIFWAFLGGIFQDVLNPIILTGTSAMAFVLVVFLVKALEHNFYGFSVALLFIVVPIATVIQAGLVFVILGVQSYSLNIIEYLQFFILPSLLINLVAALPIYLGLRLIQRRVPRRQSPWEVAQISVADS